MSLPELKVGDDFYMCGKDGRVLKVRVMSWYWSADNGCQINTVVLEEPKPGYDVLCDEQEGE